jgi:hypothetical protein
MSPILEELQENARNNELFTGELTTFQCDVCWFVNLTKRRSFDGSESDSWSLKVIRRANLDICSVAAKRQQQMD